MLPFSCASERGEIRLSKAADTSYRIFGKREEQIFTVCPAGRAAACTNMMVHRFSISCGAERISWARVAHAAQSLGFNVPRDLPPGFAPVTPFSGRFVLPALTRSNPVVTAVSTEVLSPDSVIDRSNDPAPGPNSTWNTVVKSEMQPEAGNGALRVGITVAGLMMVLLAASLAAAGRWREFAFALEDFSHTFAAFLQAAVATIVTLWHAIVHRVKVIAASWQHGMASRDDESIANALMMLQARLAETELSVATLPTDMLLREVLNAELTKARDRIDTVERDNGRWAPDKVSGHIRGLVRELDRIARIAQSAVQSAASGFRGDETEVPRSVVEAYQVLGLNSNAAPEVAKKLVDALRMSWHPDYAEDEGDRRRRENRMKQINAAWDIVNGRREAA